MQSNSKFFIKFSLIIDFTVTTIYKLILDDLQAATFTDRARADYAAIQWHRNGQPAVHYLENDIGRM